MTTSRGISLGRDSAKGIRKQALELALSPLFMATVTAVDLSSATARIQPTGVDTPGTELHAEIEGAIPRVGRRVVCARIGNEVVILGTIAQAADLSFGTVTVDGLIAPSPVFLDGAQSTSDTGSTASTSVWAQGMSSGLVLPVGTWAIYVSAGIGLIHSAAGAAQTAPEIDGNLGTARTLNCPSGAPNHKSMVGSHSLGGVAGNRTVTIRVMFKSSDAGTTSANNPWMTVQARRTS